MKTKTFFSVVICSCILLSNCTSGSKGIQSNSKSGYFFNFSNKVEKTEEQPLMITETGTNTIKIALLLDTSSSMDGLLEQAKSQLWKIVNQLSYAKKNNEPAKLEISLYQYGNDYLTLKSGFVQQILPLSNDLDEISEKLFALSTFGGEEYCGAVITASTDSLNWNLDARELNLIFICGNESFDQGKVSFKEACTSAKNKNITVNTIFCGKRDQGINTHWQKGATLTEGSFMNIDMDQATAYIESPYDLEIASYNDSLNETYIGYGAMGSTKVANQLMQDKNSRHYGMSNNVTRTISKSSHLYYNSSWDLVDAVKDSTFKIEDVLKGTLPQEMQQMSSTEIIQCVNVKSERRKYINTKIGELNQKRLEYIAQMEKSDGMNSLDYAMLEAIKKQAIAKGFVFE